MAICPVCGCKTDELDFVDSSINGLEKKVCSFCDRQLKGFGEEATTSQIRWLSAVLAKEVEREEDVKKALKDLFDKYGSGEVIVQQVAKSKTPVMSTKISSDDFDDKDKVIAQLVKRVEMLEKELVSMKRKQMIKTLIEILLPVILGITILLIFFSSGLFDTLSSLYNQFMM